MGWAWTKRREARRIARLAELAEMDDRNLAVKAKVDSLKKILAEISEKKRGANDR